MGDELGIQNGKQIFQNVVERLRTKIMTAEWQQGTRLNIRSIAQELGVSFTPVRDAINILAQEGLVTVIPRSGVFVTKYTEKDVRELYGARMTIEPTIVRCHGHMVDETWLSRARSLLDADEAISLESLYVDKAAFERSMELDGQFHLHLVGLAANERLTDIIKGLNVHRRTARYLFGIRPERNPTPRREHREILSSLSEGDYKTAADTLHHHIENAMNVHCKRLVEMEHYHTQ